MVDSYTLLTRPPLVSTPKGLLPFDLHVLGMPPAFNLSQDQTLQLKAFAHKRAIYEPVYNRYCRLPFKLALMQVLAQIVWLFVTLLKNL